ncbi:MAG: hypothetical protein AAB869_03260 [Patescibacteria group bacterium]
MLDITVRLMTFEEVKALGDDPKFRYFPKEIFDQAASLQGLIALPAYDE